MFKRWDGRTKRLWLLVLAIGLGVSGLVLLSNGFFSTLVAKTPEQKTTELKENVPLAINGVNTGNVALGGIFWQQSLSWGETDWFEIDSVGTKYVASWDGQDLTPHFTLPNEVTFAYPFDTSYLLYAVGDPSQLKWIERGIAQDILTLKPSHALQDMYFNSDRKELFMLYLDAQGQTQFAEVSVKKELVQLANLGLGEWSILSVDFAAARFKNLQDNTCAELDMLTKQRKLVDCPGDGIRIKNATKLTENTQITLKNDQKINLGVGEFVHRHLLHEEKLLVVLSMSVEGGTPALAAPEFTYLYDTSDLSAPPQKVDLPIEMLKEVIVDKNGQFILITDSNLYLFEENKWVKIESNLCLADCTYTFLDN